MLKGIRKSYNLSSNRQLPLENYTHIYLHNQGSSSVSFGDINIPASEKHTIPTHGIAVTEKFDVQFSGTPEDNQLYLYVVSVTECI